MDLTPGQQRLAFAVVVLALAGLGIYLIGSRGSGGTPAAAPSTPAGTSVAPAASSPTTPGVPPTMLPSATPASTAGGAEIYQWLPFTPADLSAAASTTTSFAKAYATWSYTESPSAYAATFQGLATASEITSLEAGYSTAGVAQQRNAEKQVSTGSGTIDLINAFGSGSITFEVTIANTVTSTQPTVKSASQYDVTVVSSGGSWQVSNIQLTGLGNR